MTLLRMTLSDPKRNFSYLNIYNYCTTEHTVSEDAITEEYGKS